MIRIETDENSFVRIEGHAGYAPIGQDIVCAAVSSLFLTLKHAVGSNESDKETEIRIRGPDQKQKTLIQSFTWGMKQTALAYPDNIDYRLVE